MANVTYGGPVRSKGGFADMILGNLVLTNFVRHTKIPTAEVLTLGTTPVEVIPAVGAGNFFKLDRAILYQDYAGTAYVDGGTDEKPVIQLGGGGAVLTETIDNTLVDTAADFLLYFSVLPVTAAVDSTSVVWTQLPANESAEITTTGDLITGNSDWDVICWYSVYNATGLQGLTA